MPSWPLWPATALVVLLAACGGAGGGDGRSTAPPGGSIVTSPRAQPDQQLSHEIGAAFDEHGTEVDHQPASADLAALTGSSSALLGTAAPRLGAVASTDDPAQVLGASRVIDNPYQPGGRDANSPFPLIKVDGLERPAVPDGQVVQGLFLSHAGAARFELRRRTRRRPGGGQERPERHGARERLRVPEPSQSRRSRAAGQRGVSAAALHRAGARPERRRLQAAEPLRHRRRVLSGDREPTRRSAARRVDRRRCDVDADDRPPGRADHRDALAGRRPEPADGVDRRGRLAVRHGALSGHRAGDRHRAGPLAAAGEGPEHQSAAVAARRSTTRSGRASTAWSRSRRARATCRRRRTSRSSKRPRWSTA